MEKVVRMYDLEGNFLEEFKSIKNASTELKIAHSDISNCVNDRVHKVESFQFRLLKTSRLKYIGSVVDLPYGREKIKVGKYWKDKLISVYNSITEAADKNDLNTGSIQQNILGERNSVNGFVFKKIE